MKVRKSLFFTFGIFFFSIVAGAQTRYQMPSYKNVKEMKNRQPVVIINQPDSMMLEQITKKDYNVAAQRYRDTINACNTNLKNAVAKFWTFNTQPVLYKTRDQVDALLSDKDQRDKYAFIYCCSGEDFAYSLEWNMNYEGTHLITTAPTHFAISFNFNSYPVYDVIVGNDPTPVSLYFAVSKTNAIFSYLFGLEKRCDMKDMIIAHAPLLKKKTLLIAGSSVTRDVKYEIKTYYPGPYKLVDNAELQAAVASGNPDDAYIVTTGDRDINHVDFVVSCEDGTLLAYTDYGKADATTIFSESLYPYFNKDFFLDIAGFYNGTVKK